LNKSKRINKTPIQEHSFGKEREERGEQRSGTLRGMGVKGKERGNRAEGMTGK